MMLVVLSARAERLEIIWPTPDKAFWEGRPWQEYVQPTASGVPESGLYGGVRSGGAQFHEGLDIKPIKRDRKGEPLDDIFAVMPGVVRHISKVAGNSSYGRYVVIEHTGQEPAVCTLYAHLSAVASGLSVGTKVEQGQVIGTMGRSSSGAAIPPSRAHLHFEICLWITDNFQSWYNAKKFGSRNEHGLFNGMNLVGIDPLDFYTQWHTRKVDGFLEYFQKLPRAVTVRVITSKVPDFIRRYPALAEGGLPKDGLVGGWEIVLDEYGVPFAWKALSPLEVLMAKAGEIKVLNVDEARVKRNRSKSLVVSKRGQWTLGRDLSKLLDQLF